MEDEEEEEEEVQLQAWLAERREEDLSPLPLSIPISFFNLAGALPHTLTQTAICAFLEERKRRKKSPKQPQKFFLLRKLELQRHGDTNVVSLNTQSDPERLHTRHNNSVSVCA